MNITLTAKEIKAALVAVAGKNDIRHCLKGVLIEPSADGRAILVSTNGHCLTAICTKSTASCSFNPAIIPRDLFDYVVKSEEDKCTLSIESSGDMRSINIQCGKINFQSDEINGEFPNWRKIIPSKVSGESGFYQIKNMALIGKFADLISRGDYVFYSNGGDKQAIAIMTDDSFFVVMPTPEHMPKSSEQYSKPLFISQSSGDGAA